MLINLRSNFRVQVSSFGLVFAKIHVNELEIEKAFPPFLLTADGPIAVYVHARYFW